MQREHYTSAIAVIDRFRGVDANVVMIQDALTWMQRKLYATLQQRPLTGIAKAVEVIQSRAEVLDGCL